MAEEKRCGDDVTFEQSHKKFTDILVSLSTSLLTLWQLHVLHGLSREHGHLSHQIGQILAGQVTRAGGPRRTDLAAALADDGRGRKAVVGRLDQELAFLRRQKVVDRKDGWILVDLLQSWVHDIDAVVNGCYGVDTALRRGGMVLWVLVLRILSHHGDTVAAATKIVGCM